MKVSYSESAAQGTAFSSKLSHHLGTLSVQCPQVSLTMTIATTHEAKIFELKSEGERLRSEGKLLESLDKFESRLKLLIAQKVDKVTIRNAK